MLQSADDGTLAQETLVAELAATVDDTARDVGVAFVHRHLPKLADCEHIERDQRSQKVVYCEDHLVSSLIVDGYVETRVGSDALSSYGRRHGRSLSVGQPTRGFFSADVLCDTMARSASGTTPLERLSSRYDAEDLTCPKCGYLDDDVSWKTETDGRRIDFRHLCPSCGYVRRRTFTLGG